MDTTGVVGSTSSLLLLSEGISRYALFLATNQLGYYGLHNKNAGEKTSIGQVRRIRQCGFVSRYSLKVRIFGQGLPQIPCARCGTSPSRLEVSEWPTPGPATVPRGGANRPPQKFLTGSRKLLLFSTNDKRLPHPLEIKQSVPGTTEPPRALGKTLKEPQHLRAVEHARMLVLYEPRWE
jgi:hypothetical protein